MFKLGSIVKPKEDQGDAVVVLPSKTTIDAYEEKKTLTERKEILEMDQPPVGAPMLSSTGAYRNLLLLGGDDTPETSHHEITNHMVPHKEFPR